MILVSVHTIGKTCTVRLTRNEKTIFLTKEINTHKRANFSVFKIILKGLLLLIKPIPYLQNKI